MTGTTAIEITGRKQSAELLAVVTDPIRWTQLAAAWVAVYRVNGWLWDTMLYNGFGIERTRALLDGKREGVGNVLAAGLGVITPFCSCSAVPGFIGFVAAGVPIVVTPELPDSSDKHMGWAFLLPLLHRQLLFIGSSRETSAKS